MNSHQYGGPFRVGDRVHLSPALDDWMRGDRVGTVALVGRKWLSVVLDRSGKRRRIAADLLAADIP